MPTFTVTTTIRAPRERVFDLARDVDVHARSLARTREEVVGATRRLLELGDEVTFRARHLGLRRTHTACVVAYDRPRAFTDEMVRGAFVRFRHEHVFEEDRGVTAMTDTTDFATHYGRAVESLVLVPYLRRLVAERGRALKELAE